MSITSEIERWITEHGSAAILEKHLAFFRDIANRAEKEKAELQNQLAECKKENEKVAAQLESYRRSEEFVECRGALFKRKKGGGYVHAVYCPTHKVSCAPFPPGESFCCPQCSWFSSFRESQLGVVLQEIDQ